MHGGCHLAQAQCRVLGLYWKELIAIKNPSIVQQWINRGSEVRRSRKGYCWWWFEKVLSSWLLATSPRETNANRILEKKRGCIRMECLWSPEGGSQLHLSPFECQSVCYPKKQPHQHSSREHSNAIKDEVTKFNKTGAIKEVFYPEWLANTVVVRKKNGKW